jgi:hypothetical protein
MVVVALGEPGVPVICWEIDGAAVSMTIRPEAIAGRRTFGFTIFSFQAS